MRSRCRQYYLDNLRLSKALMGYRTFYLHLVQAQGPGEGIVMREELEKT
jgi:hypothetical protein